MVIGLNHRTAPLPVRERFWISENRRYEVLRQLKSAEGIEEVVVLSTCSRTEFFVWASEPTLAANSILHYLSSEHGLKLTEWEHFCRRLDEAALAYIFRLTCGLDSQTLCEQEVLSRVKAAWAQARTVAASGPFLNAVLERALAVAEIARTQSGLEQSSVSIADVAVSLAQKVFGSLAGRRVLLLGSGEAGEGAARMMVENGAKPVIVIDQSAARAEQLATQIGGTAVGVRDRWKWMLQADIVLCSTGCPHFVLTREEAERIAAERNRVAMVIVDMGMPRDVDPEVRRVDGILLYDLEGLERTLGVKTADRKSAQAQAEKIIAAEAQTFRGQLLAQNAVPTSVALRQRLDDICRQELDAFYRERGPFTREQDQSLHAITARVIQKIASSLAHELKELPEKGEQEQMTAAVRRLFHLDSPQRALAGTRSEKETNERNEPAIAI